MFWEMFARVYLWGVSGMFEGYAGDVWDMYVRKTLGGFWKKFW